MKKHKILGIRPQNNEKLKRKIENRPLLLYYESIHYSKTVFVSFLALLVIDLYTFEGKELKVYRNSKKLNMYLYI